jgi:hypothetical protein
MRTWRSLLLLDAGDADRGNLVLYHNCNSSYYAVWASNTRTKGYYALMQADGNLVVYNSSGQAQWSSRTNGNSGAFLAVQEDGNLGTTGARRGSCGAGEADDLA